MFAGMPGLVAETIEHAVTTDKPKLRYLVGADAEALMAGRAKATDEEWIEDGRPMSDDEFIEQMRQRFGVNLFSKLD